MCFQFYTLVVLKYYIGAELRHSVSQLFFPTNIHLEGFFFPLKSCSHENCGNIFILYFFVEAKVRGYLNTSTVYIYIKKEKVSIHIKKSNGTGLFIFAFPMINDAPMHTWKLMAKQGNISNSFPKHTNTNPLCYSNPCSRILRYGNSKSIVKS